ncbi:hypothetical protein ACFXKS_18985 [Streptomyces scopuliridis]|uniref:effector-associated constant component EACC1 n=1 Tax=Streptomyces scopuliridis TaxID=452529 RepID=UPI0036A2BB6F
MTEDVIRILLEEDSEEELRSLADYLREDEDLCGRVRLGASKIESGYMGGVVNELIVATGPILAAAAIQYLVDWLKQRRAAPQRMFLQLRHRNGEEMKITLDGSGDPIALIREMNGFFESER